MTLLMAFLIGTVWLLTLAFLEFVGFWTYCLRRSNLMLEREGEAIFRTARKRLFSRGWWLSSTASTILVGFGLAVAKEHISDDTTAYLGIVAALVGLGMSVICNLYRFDRFYSDARRNLGH